MNASKSAPQTSAPAAPALGSLLREAREARELSLDTVADELMIRKYYLESLEDGLYRQLPERVYAVGFVQNYAQLLGLDANALVEQFKREAYGGRGAAAARMELAMPAPVTQSLMPNRSAIFIVAGLLVVLIIGGIAWNARSPHAPETQIPKPPMQSDDLSLNSVSSDASPATPPAPVPEKTAIVSSTGTVTTTNPDTTFVSPDENSTGAVSSGDETAPLPKPAPAAVTETKPTPSATSAPVAENTAAPAVTNPAVPKGTRVMVEAIQPSWVEIADTDGNILFTNILRLGQALPIPNRDGITLTTGNAAGVQIVLDGKKLGPLGKTGEVKRAIPLEPSKLAH